MKPFTKLLLSVGLGLLAMAFIAFFAVTISQAQSAQRSQAVKKFGGDIGEVVVAAHDIAPNQKITADDVTMTKYVVALLPRGSFAKTSDVIGKTTSSLVLAGEPVSTARLGGQATMALDVPSGQVAVSIPSQDVLAVGGAVHAGSHVDIYASTAEGVFPVALNVLVLTTSADNTGSTTAGLGSSGALTWVTLAVADDKLRDLIRYSEGNALHLVLRGSVKPAAPATTTPTPSGK